MNFWQARFTTTWVVAEINCRWSAHNRSNFSWAASCSKRIAPTFEESASRMTPTSTLSTATTLNYHHLSSVALPGSCVVMLAAVFSTFMASNPMLCNAIHLHLSWAARLHLANSSFVDCVCATRFNVCVRINCAKQVAAAVATLWILPTAHPTRVQLCACMCAYERERERKNLRQLFRCHYCCIGGDCQKLNDRPVLAAV